VPTGNPINLAPADVKKEGPSFDLPVAIGMAAASEQIESDQLENSMDFAEVKGQESVKRAMEIAAAGGHNLLMLF
jgi:magnesium chelatase family protein